MSESRFLTWLATCREESTRGSGLTAGDLMHCGLRDYVERFPCPNGLPVDRSRPRESAAYRARVDRARRDIERHKEACELTSIEFNAAMFSAEDVSGLVGLVGGVFDE